MDENLIKEIEAFTACYKAMKGASWNGLPLEQKNLIHDRERVARTAIYKVDCLINPDFLAALILKANISISDYMNHGAMRGFYGNPIHCPKHTLDFYKTQWRSSVQQPNSVSQMDMFPELNEGEE